eukprot:s418_g1.t1
MQSQDGVALAALGWLWWRPWSPLVAVAPRLFCVAGVTLGDICLHFVWQAWHFVTSAFVLCGRRGTCGTGLALVAALVGTVAPRLFCVARVALGDIRVRFVWQAWRLATYAFVLCGRPGTWCLSCGRCGTYGAGLALVAALVGLLYHSGHCRTAIASPRSHWALPDFNRDCQIAVGTAGLQSRAPDRSGHCRTSAASSRSQWALPDFSCQLQTAVSTAGLQSRAPHAASSRSQWALPDCNREPQIALGTTGLQPGLPDRSGHCRTSAASSRSQRALPGFICQLQIAEYMSAYMSERKNAR